MQQFDAFAIFQGHTQRQEQVPAIRPLAIGIQFAGAVVGQVTGVEQRGQRLFIAVGYAADFGVKLIVIGLDQNLRPGVAITLHALGQVMLDGLFKCPVAKADHVAVVGIGEETGNAFGTAQFQGDIGVGSGTQGDGCESQSCKF
ncbi:hypothetical protein D9M69_583370 [compost metagenome]